MYSGDVLSSRHDFGGLADRYDCWYQTGKGKVYDLIEKQTFLDLIGTVPPGKELLEIGCGTGWWSSFFSRLGFSVTGVDISSEMVDAARVKNIPAATFQEVDAHELPFADNSFSASAAITSLEFMREPPKVMQEMVRCTKSPGGIIYLGLLNPIAKINRKRRNKSDSLYAKARFFTLKEIEEAWSRHGMVQSVVCAFPFPVMLGVNGIWLDRLETRLRFKHGAFVAVRVDL